MNFNLLLKNLRTYTDHDLLNKSYYFSHEILTVVGGPLWSAQLHDKEFVNNLIRRAQRDADKFGTSKRIVGMMTIVSEELHDVPLYYVPEKLCGVVHTTSPSFLVIR